MGNPRSSAGTLTVVEPAEATATSAETVCT